MTATNTNLVNHSPSHLYSTLGLGEEHNVDASPLNDLILNYAVESHPSEPTSPNSLARYCIQRVKGRRWADFKNEPTIFGKYARKIEQDPANTALSVEQKYDKLMKKVYAILACSRSVLKNELSSKNAVNPRKKVVSDPTQIKNLSFSKQANMARDISKRRAENLISFFHKYIVCKSPVAELFFTNEINPLLSDAEKARKIRQWMKNNPTELAKIESLDVTEYETPVAVPEAKYLTNLPSKKKGKYEKAILYQQDIKTLVEIYSSWFVSKEDRLHELGKLLILPNRANPNNSLLFFEEDLRLVLQRAVVKDKSLLMPAHFYTFQQASIYNALIDLGETAVLQEYLQNCANDNGALAEIFGHSRLIDSGSKEQKSTRMQFWRSVLRISERSPFEDALIDLIKRVETILRAINTLVTHPFWQTDAVPMFAFMIGIAMALYMAEP